MCVKHFLSLPEHMKVDLREQRQVGDHDEDEIVATNPIFTILTLPNQTRVEGRAEDDYRPFQYSNSFICIPFD
jgi:hypothetical protein